MGVCDVPIVVDSLAEYELEQSSNNEDDWYHLEAQTVFVLERTTMMMMMQTNEGETQPTL